MQALSATYPVRQLAGLLGVAGSYYYQAVGDDDLALLSRMRTCWRTFRPTVIAG
jgi:hypothetical protein